MHNGRNSQQFRPDLTGITLEERVVLSTGNSLWELRHFLIADNRAFLHTQYSKASLAPATTVGASYNTQFLAGFFDALKELQSAATTYLGNLSSTTARATFESDIKGTLDALTAQLTSQLSLLTPASKALQSRVQQMILSAGSTSLISVLGSIPVPATGTGTDATAFNLKISSALAATRDTAIAQLDVFLANQHLTNQRVTHAIQARTLVDAAANTTNRALIKDAFAGFANDYALGAGSWLKGPSTSSIATNRPAFDVNAQSAANSLTAILSSALAITPGSSSLIPAIQERLLGTGGLLDSLDALANPTDLSGTSAANFGKEASQLISVAYNDVSKLYNTFANAKTVSPTLSTGYNSGFGGGFSGFGNGYIPGDSSAPIPGQNYVPTFLQQFGFNNTLLGLGANGASFTYGQSQYGQANGLSLTTGFNYGFNTTFTTATGLNYKQVGGLVN